MLWGASFAMMTIRLDLSGRNRLLIDGARSLLLPRITRKIAKRDRSYCCEFTSFEYREPLVERVLKYRIVVLLMIGGNVPASRAKPAHLVGQLPTVERIQKFSVHTAIWLFVCDPKKLDEVEREDLAAFCQASTTLERAYQLIQAFLTMDHKREGHRLDACLEQVRVSGPPELQSFAAGVERDKDAVQAGLTWWINNGQVEGQVTKLKLVKRQMYGKAGFALLRKRVLHAL
jgi:Transposase